jgi:hypothetical protein
MNESLKNLAAEFASGAVCANDAKYTDQLGEHAAKQL